MFTVRIFRPSDQEYQAITNVHNAEWPDDPATTSTWQYNDKNRDGQYLFQRVVVETDEQIVAEGHFGEDAWSPVPGKYYFTYSMHPDHQGDAIQQAMVDFVLEQLATRSPVPTQLWVDSREDRSVRTNFLLEHGFAVAMREPRSILDVTRFEPDRFANVEEPARREGLELMSLAEYQMLDPDWQRKYWQIRLEIDRDIPWPDPIKPISFEDFVKKLEHPHFLAEAHFVAVNKHGGTAPNAWQIVGVTQVGVDPNHQEKVHQWITGVSRDFRRKGLATALKVRCINFVAASGARYIETDNDENNPMYGINLALGFESQPALLALKKDL